MEKRDLLELAKRLDVVFIFCGDICPKKEGEDYPSFEGWRSTRGLEADKTGPVFSYERGLAAARLWQMNNKLILIPSGGATNVEGCGKRPFISSVVRFELENLGVSPESILEEDQAFNTHQQVVLCDRMAMRENWNRRRVAILAPCWQLGRILAMIAYSDDLEVFKARLTQLISMEMVLSAIDETRRGRFLEAYADPRAREMFALEALGAGQVCGGFQPPHPYPYPGFPHPLLMDASPM